MSCKIPDRKIIIIEIIIQKAKHGRLIFTSETSEKNIEELSSNYSPDILSTTVEYS